MFNVYIDFEFFAQCPDLRSAVALCREQLSPNMDRYRITIYDDYPFIACERYNGRWHFRGDYHV